MERGTCGVSTHPRVVSAWRTVFLFTIAIICIAIVNVGAAPPASSTPSPPPRASSTPPPPASSTPPPPPPDAPIQADESNLSPLLKSRPAYRSYEEYMEAVNAYQRYQHEHAHDGENDGEVPSEEDGDEGGIVGSESEHDDLNDDDVQVGDESESENEGENENEGGDGESTTTGRTRIQPWNDMEGPEPTLDPRVYSVCNFKTAEQIVEKCKEATDFGGGVYVPMLNYTRGETPELFPASWYDEMRKLKNETDLNIMGIYTGEPNYDTIKRILKTHPGIFDGVLLDGDNAEGACINKLRPHGELLDGAEVRYFMGGQNPKTCLLKDGKSCFDDKHMNTSGRSMPIPSNVVPVFPCFNGAEGRCYKVFTSSPDSACNTRQRYAFARYGHPSEDMLNLLTEICRSAGKDLPPYDLVQVL